MNNLKKDILVYYAFCFLTGMYLANGTAVLFERALGLSFQQIFLLGAVYMLMFVLFEIPSGALADLVGRKKSLMLGGLTLALASAATGLSDTFMQLFFSFFLWALGFSFISGADEALLYDKIKDQKHYVKIMGRAHFWVLVGTALAGIVGPQLFIMNFRFAFLFSAVPFFLAAVAIAFFAEEFTARGFSWKEHWQQIKTGVKISYQNRFVAWSIGIKALTFGVAYTFLNSYQPYLRDIGFSLTAFSVILPVMYVSEAFGGRFAHRIESRFGETAIFNISLLLIAVTLGLMGIFPWRMSIIWILLLSFTQGLVRPVISTYLNRYVEAKNRATVVSVQGMLATITAAVILSGFGFLTDRIGIANLLTVLGIVVLVFAALLLRFRPKEHGL